MTRREFPRKVMVAAFRRADGRCEGAECGARLTVGKFRYDHIVPDALGGEPTLENCQVICMACDSQKTPADLTRLAKAKRIEARHVGAKPRASRPMPGGRGSRWKRKVGGQVVERET